jgi:hypothetical protein
MPTRVRILVPLGTALAALLALGLAFGACGQEEGERCQRTEDCAEGLTCNLGTQLCQEQGTGGNLDAGVDVPLDADEPDAPADAAPDASPDAPPL